jgi:hypothetical protein
MARGPSPGTASGHLGEARRTVVAGPQQQRLKGPRGEVHLRIIWMYHWRVSASFAVRQVLERASSDGGAS